MGEERTARYDAMMEERRTERERLLDERRAERERLLEERHVEREANGVERRIERERLVHSIEELKAGSVELREQVETERQHRPQLYGP